MKQLKKVTAYKCHWCGKLFLSERHDCKFDPDKTNCLSCKKCLGVSVEERQRYFECSDDIHPSLTEVANGQYASDRRRGNRHYHVDCGSYEQLENYEGSKTYAEHLQEIEFEKFIKEIF